VPLFNATVRLDRGEDLEVLSLLDRFYAATKGTAARSGTVD